MKLGYTRGHMDGHFIPVDAPTASIHEGVALEKQGGLFESLRKLESLLVAFSGGADSAYLAWAAHCVLHQRTCAVTALSPSFSAYDREQAANFVREAGLRHEFIETREFENPLYAANGADRCFHCKDELFTRMKALARERNVQAIAYGINLDDTRDFRPGHRAALDHRILAPLLDARLHKQEIRWLSRRAGLSTWDRPASPCLSSRVPYGIAVTPELLGRVERAEAAVRELGFRQFRVRALGETARLELAPDELPRGRQMDVASRLAPRFRQLGFASVQLDPQGYRQGSLNSLLQKKAANSPGD